MRLIKYNFIPGLSKSYYMHVYIEDALHNRYTHMCMYNVYTQLYMHVYIAIYACIQLYMHVYTQLYMHVYIGDASDHLVDRRISNKASFIPSDPNEAVPNKELFLIQGRYQGSGYSDRTFYQVFDVKRTDLPYSLHFEMLIILLRLQRLLNEFRLQDFSAGNNSLATVNGAPD